VPQSIPPAFIPEKNRLNQPSPFLVLVQVRLPTTPETLVRITPNPEPIQFGTDSAGAPLTWDPFPVGFGDIQTDSDGSTPEFTMTVGNLTREIMALLIAHDWLMGQDVVVRIVHQDLLADPTAEFRMDFVITGVAGDEQSLTFSLSTENVYQYMGPNELIIRDACSFTYKSRRCGFLETSDPGEAILGPCVKSFAACQARGARELAIGAPVQHPQRFGGAPGIPVR